VVPSGASTYSLRQCLELADLRHPNIQAARARVDMMRAQLDEARTAPFSGFSLTAGAGPAPTFRGGQVYTQDREVGLNSNLGLAWQASFNGTIPLWTFGKITNLWRAAEAQIEVGEGEAQKARNAVKLDVRRAYYGLLLAREALSLLGEAAGQLDKVIKPLQQKVAEGEGDELDLLRLQTSRAELDARLAEARRAEQVTLGALRFYTGVEGGFDIPPEGLRMPKREIGPLPDYLDAARQHRPELRMARAGLAAREAQVDLARSKLLPDLGLSLSASYSRAPEITDQLNPFVRDDANYLRYGFAIGMRWSLDLAPGVARVRQAEAQLDEMRHTMRYASGGTALEVEKAHAEAIETRKKVDAYKAASKFARQWMIKVVQGIDVGVFEERDLVDPARQYALQRYSYLNALMDHNMAVANLAQVTGHDPIAEPLD
jgi:outer membrane protein TolC